MISLSTTDIFKKLSRTNKDLLVLSEDQLKTVQKIELETLKDILIVCHDMNIGYHLTGGSALGTMRHHGFIPWDDDIDIDIVRKDIDRFLDAFEKEFGEKYWIHSYRTKGVHCIPSIAIQRKSTIFQGCTDPTPEECGISIDIAIIENTYNNKFLRNIHGLVSLIYGFIVSCRRFAMNKDYLMKLAGNNKEFIKVFKQKIFWGRLFSFHSLEKWIDYYNRWNSKCRDEKSEYVTVPTGRKHFFGELYRREDFVDYTNGVFEGLEVRIPKNIDGYLKHMYGENYMTIPPVGDREQHALMKFDVNIDDKQDY